jgi:hypothetical protein
MGAKASPSIGSLSLTRVAAWLSVRFKHLADKRAKFLQICGLGCEFMFYFQLKKSTPPVFAQILVLQVCCSWDALLMKVWFVGLKNFQIA